MYTLDQLSNRIIWNFKERRSGSTWFIAALCQSINKTSQTFYSHVWNDSYTKEFYKNRKQSHDDHKTILNGHDFCALEYINNYTNPILIRNSRKNITEQFVSNYITRLTKIHNIKGSEIDNFPKFDPVTIHLDDVNFFIARKKEIEKLWDTYASQYENETVYYEDLLEGWESTIFPVKLKMTDKDNELTKKLPYNKTELIINYNEIDSILKDKLGYR